jgi:hypothetical protein
VPRHYIALHGLKATEIDSLGFTEATDQSEIPVVIRVLGAQMPWGLTDCAETGRYLVLFDVAANDGQSPVPTATTAAEAAVFANEADAFAFYQTQSRVTPLRDDGQPNRPLTAFTVELEPAP